MSELPPDESSIAAVGADPGRRKAAAHEARGVQTFAVTSAPAATPIGRADTTASPVSTTGRIEYLLAEGRRKVFVFRDRPTQRDDVLAFYGDTISVRPLAFASTIKDMKGLLHNG
jgi:hypothetical protein